MKINLFNLENFSLFSKGRISSQCMRLLKDALCDNQGWIVEFSYLGSEKHKKIKNELKKKSPNITNLKSNCEDLINYLESELREVCQNNFKNYLLKYFENRSWIEPRVCVKVHNNGNIIPLFRDRTLIPNKEYPISANTAFEQIYETGNYYICPDIPTHFKQRNYKNARIIEQNALLYSSPLWITEKYHKCAGKPDDKWMNCWEIPKDENGNNIAPHPETCYKSTLVIPMTLYNNTLSREFRNQFEIKELSPKTIYGFLCFDNHNSAFFNEKQDVYIGYIFADILSLYLINKLIYTTYSSTFQSAKRKIKQIE